MIILKIKEQKNNNFAQTKTIGCRNGKLAQMS
jgi:hypothetical protein